MSPIVANKPASSHQADFDLAARPETSGKPIVKPKRSKWVHIALAFGLVLLLIEGLSWLLIAMMPHSGLQRTTAIYADQSDQIRRFLDTRAPQHRTMHPVLGWTSNPNFRSPTTCTNSKALRGTREYTPVAKPNVLRIAAFGSSIVECNEVDDANAWPALMESQNPDMEVLNYGVGGYGTDQAYLRYLAEGAEFAPKVVLIGYTSDELGRAVNRYRRFISTEGQGPFFKPRYLLGTGGELALLDAPLKTRADYERVLANPSEIINIGKNDYWYQPGVYENPLYNYSAAVRLLSWMAGQVNRRLLNPDRLYIGKEFNEKSTAFQIQLALFSKFAEAVRSAGAIPVIVLLPEKESVARALAGGAKLYDPLLTHLNDRQIEFVDAIDAFRAAGPNPDIASWYASGGHYSAQGNKVIAAWLPGKIRSIVANHAQRQHN